MASVFVLSMCIFFFWAGYRCAQVYVPGAPHDTLYVNGKDSFERSKRESCSTPCYATKLCPSVSRSSRFSANHTEFFKAFGGDKTRYSLQSYLTKSSIVMEVGGYTGVDIIEMQRRFGFFRTLLFEPIFFEEARANLNDRNVKVYPYGLGKITRQVLFDIKGDGTKEALTGKPGEIRNFEGVVQQLGISNIDLLQINCEGCEWEVLEASFSSIQTFQHIQVQFHASADWVENRLERYAVIQDELTKTHELIYDQPWIWQLWRRKRHI